MESRIITLREGSRPFWQTVVAALLYTLTLYCIYQVISYWSIRWIHVGTEFIELGGIAFIGAISFSVLRTFCFDLDNKQLRTIYNVSIFKYATKERIELDYVSLFRKNPEALFEVSVWFKMNKHIELANFKTFNDARVFAKNFADKLETDFLDSTERGNPKWSYRVPE
jgi:hypothetical protein